VEPLVLGAVILGAGLLAESLEDRADGGGALGGEVAADDGGAAEVEVVQRRTDRLRCTSRLTSG
jgi:hypothetical protein